MLRVRFTSTDVDRLSVAPATGMLTESVFALEAFGRARPGEFGAWRARVRIQLGPHLGAVRELAQAGHSAGELLRMARGGAGRTVAGTLRLFARVAVAPYWELITRHLAASHSTDAQRLLGRLHPRLRWRPPVLEVPDAEDRDVDLGGRGLTLSPSFFLTGRSAALLDGGGTTTPTLVVSAPGRPRLVATHRPGERARERALGALIGHTRAAALRALTTRCTTGELAERLHVTISGASKHAAVLREAGLVTTERIGNTSVHELTVLGRALLHNELPEVVGPRSLPHAIAV